MRVLVSDQAHEDLDEIEGWYFEQGEHLPDLFYNEFEELLLLIGKNPHSGILLSPGYRMYMLTRFPYYVVAQIHEDSAEVLHVFHHDRHPKLRKKRIK